MAIFSGIQPRYFTTGNDVTHTAMQTWAYFLWPPHIYPSSTLWHVDAML